MAKQTKKPDTTLQTTEAIAPVTIDEKVIEKSVESAPTETVRITTVKKKRKVKSMKTLKTRPKRENKPTEADARTLVAEMIKGGATMTKIASAVRISYPTILALTSGKTKSFRKMTALQTVYSRWKAGEWDLTSQRRRRKGVKEAVKVPKKRVVRRTRVNKDSKMDLSLPVVDQKMISELEKEIERMKLRLQFMKDVWAIKKKYGK